MQLREVFERTVGHFKKLSFASPRLDAELLLAHALKWDRLQIYLKFDYPLSTDELEVCRELVRRRSQGEPVAYLCGHKGFYKSDFLVEPGVLIPRPETEHIVERALELFPHRKQPFLMVELGVGSGCLGLSILAERPQARLIGLDASEVAVRLTQRNGERLDLSGRLLCFQKDADFLNEDFLMEQWGSLADLVVSNPPYIADADPDVDANVKKFEPHQALFAGAEGLDKISLWTAIAKRLLKPGGHLIFEIGARQGARSHEIMIANGLVDLMVGKDLAGYERWISGQMPGPSRVGESNG